MATDEDTTTRHPVPTGVRDLSAGVTALAERPLFALDAAVTRETIVALADLKARLAAYEYAVLAHAEQVQVGSETGCTSTAVWAANATRTRKNVVAGQVRLATSLESRWHRVRDALAAGAVERRPGPRHHRLRWRTSPTTSTPASSTRLRRRWSGTQPTSTPSPWPASPHTS